MTEHDSSIHTETRALEGADEVHFCADLMANTEPWITLGRTYEDSVKIVTHPAREVYVALVEGELVGFTILQTQGTFVGYIQTVAVRAKWRGKGIGSKMIKAAEDRIFGEFPNSFITVSSFNQGAQELYQRLGYEVVGELKDFIIRGHSELLMRKTIGPLAEYHSARH